MGFEYIREVPQPQAILTDMPLSLELSSIKKRRDQEIRSVFRHESERLLLILGLLGS